MECEPMIRLKNLSKYYQGKENVVKALDSINIEFNLGEFVVITGESGSGKSTFLNVISGLDTYEDGELYINDEETAHYSPEEWENYRRKNISFIFQNYNIVDAYTVYQNVDAALLVQGIDKETRKEKAMDLIEKVGLSKQAHQKASQLSGGEKQRTAIARALAKDSPVIVADEPTGNLDKTTSETIIKLLKEISKDRLVLLVSHNYASKEPYATRHVRLFDGEIVEDKTVREYEEIKEVPTSSSHESLGAAGMFLLAIRNLFSMPKKTLFTLFIALFVVIVFSMTYGSYVQQTQASVISQSHPNFQNSFEGRLVISRKDQGEMSQGELETFSNYSEVEAVVPYDMIFDRWAYLSYELIGGEFGEQGDVLRRAARVRHIATFDEGDLVKGRLPEDESEVVIDSTSEHFQLGQTVSLAYGNEWDMPNENDLGGKTVVGISEGTDYFQLDLYLHASYFESEEAKVVALAGNGITIGNDGDPIMDVYHEYLVMDPTQEVGTFTYISSIYEDESGEVNPEFKDKVGETYTFNYIHSFDNTKHTLDMILESIESGDENQRSYSLLIHPDTLSLLYEDIGIHQVSLISNDAYDAKEIQDKLGDDYYSVYPAGYTNQFANISKTIIKLFLGGLSIFVLILMYFIAYVALRNVMGSRSKTFVILRSIGAKKKELNYSLILELMLIMSVALVLTIAAFNLRSLLPNIIPDYLRYFSFSNYLFMITALLIMSMFLGFRFNKKIFRKSVISAFREE